MINDQYLEQIFKIRLPKRVIGQFILICSLAFLVGFAILLFVPWLWWLYTVLAASLVYYLSASLSLEYEYSLLNSELTIAVIYQMKRRNNLAFLDWQNLKSWSEITDELDYQQLLKQHQILNFTNNDYKRGISSGFRYIYCEFYQLKAMPFSLLGRQRHLETQEQNQAVLLMLSPNLYQALSKYLR